MHNPNCPRCNMYLAPGAQTCPNCNLNLQQLQFQQTHHAGQSFQAQTATDGAESRKEKAYRKLLITVAIVLMGEFLVYRIPNWLYSWFGTSVHSLTRPIEWLLTIAWAGVPLLIALVLPKKNGARVILIVFGSIFALWRVVTFVYDEFVYNPWDDGGIYPPVYYNF